MRAPDSARRAAERLTDGSSTLTRRLADRFAARCRRARRDDLTGLKAALGPLLLLGLAAGAAWLLAGIVRARPWLMWLVTGAWCLVAWRAGRGAAETPSAKESTTGPAPAPEDVYDATLTWIWQMIGDRQGVHLRDLLANAQAVGLFEGLDVAQLRGHLKDWDIPVRPSVRVRGQGVKVGIHRDDLPTPSQPLPEAEGQEPPNPRLHVA